MAPRTGKTTQKKATNLLAQRLDGNNKSSSKNVKSSTRSKTNVNNKKKSTSNPLLARLQEKPKGKNGLSDNPLAQRIRNGTGSSKLNFIPPSITKQTQALQKQKLNKTNASKNNGKITKVSQNPISIRNKTILKIRNAATPTFLKIKNLEYGTNIKDLKVVLDTIGKTKNIKIKDLASGSALAEVIFLTEASLDQAHRQLNGAIADGRTLRTEITNDSEISGGGK